MGVAIRWGGVLIDVVEFAVAEAGRLNSGDGVSGGSDSERLLDIRRL